jgi:hypothetical protein
MIKRFLKKIALFLLSLIAISYLIVWVYEIPRRAAIENGTHDISVKWQDIHNPENDYDIIIVGSSRGDSGYNPTIIDSITHRSSYNLCSGSQNIIESYYILKEVLKYQQPKYIVFDSFLPSFSDNPDFYHVLNNAEFMSSSGRMDMIVNGFGSQGVVHYALPLLKYKTYLKRDVKQLFSSPKKFSQKAIRIRGFYVDEASVDAANIRSFGPLFTLENTLISTETVKRYLARILALCKANDVQFISVRAPYPPSRLDHHPDPAHDYFKNVFTDLKIPFYDFNKLPVPELLDFDFSDDRHLNFKGAKKVSTELGLIIEEIKGGL